MECVISVRSTLNRSICLKQEKKKDTKRNDHEIRLLSADWSNSSRKKGDVTCHDRHR